MKSLLEDLRQETQEIHSALHSNPVLKRCQENQLDLSGYIQMLLAFYQPYKKLMNSIDMVPLNSLKPLLFKRHELLYNDLLALNVDERTLTPEKSELLSQDELIGICYVVIGSSMGATLLSQNIVATLGNQPVSYLFMSPKEAGWPILSNFLRTKDSKDFSKASVAAREAFELIQTHLSSLAYLR